MDYGSNMFMFLPYCLRILITYSTARSLGSLINSWLYDNHAYLSTRIMLPLPPHMSLQSELARAETHKVMTLLKYRHQIALCAVLLQSRIYYSWRSWYCCPCLTLGGVRISLKMNKRMVYPMRRLKKAGLKCGKTTTMPYQTGCCPTHQH